MARNEARKIMVVAIDDSNGGDMRNKCDILVLEGNNFQSFTRGKK